MNSDLTPPQTVNNTDSPQTAGTTTNNLGASDANSFQKSAGPEVLSINRPLQVESTGQPITAAKAAHAPNNAATAFVLISSIVLAVIAVLVFRWVMKRPEPVKATENEPVEDKELKTTPKVVKPQLKKKKVPRSKRHK